MPLVTFEMPASFDPSLPDVKVDAIYVEPAGDGNGYACEVILLGKNVSNLRIQAITVPNLLALTQEAAKVAWAACKVDGIDVANFNMTVDRGTTQ